MSDDEEDRSDASSPAHSSAALAEADGSSQATTATVQLKLKPDAMDARYTLNKRIHARGGKGRKKDVGAKQKRADYIVWRDQQHAPSCERPGVSRQGEGGCDATTVMQTNASLADSVACAALMAAKRAREAMLTLVDLALVCYAAYLTPYEMVGAARIPMIQLIISVTRMTPAQAPQVPVSYDSDTGITRYEYVSSGKTAEHEGTPGAQHQHDAPQGRKQRRKQRGEWRCELNSSDSPLALPRPPKALEAKRAEYVPDGLTLRWATANVQTLLPYQEDRSYAKNTMSLLRSKKCAP